jgi:AraC family cel operon transcriptional repressor
MAVYRLTETYNIDAQAETYPNLISSIKYAYPLHNHDYYEFFLIVSGRCIHRVNGSEQHTAEGALVFIRPDDTHAYDYDGEGDCEFINITCAAKAVEGALGYLGSSSLSARFLSPRMPPVTILSQAERETFIADFERLKVLSTLDKPYARLYLRSLIVEIFTRYFTSEHRTVSNSLPVWLEDLLTGMQKKENFTAGLDRMYEIAPRSPGHLNRAFRQHLRTTPTAYINSLRLGYAKNLLMTTEQSIVETAFESGFDNLSHFYHLFKAEFKTTPKELRKTREMI